VLAQRIAKWPTSTVHDYKPRRRAASVVSAEVTFYFEVRLTSFVRHLNKNTATKLPGAPSQHHPKSTASKSKLALQYSVAWSRHRYPSPTASHRRRRHAISPLPQCLTRTLNDYARKTNCSKERRQPQWRRRSPGLTSSQRQTAQPAIEAQTKSKLNNAKFARSESITARCSLNT